MIHEHRVYHCVPGRLQTVLQRFETAVLPIWKKYGFRPVGFWTVAIGSSNQDIYYLLAWESLAEREQKLEAFRKDADWIAERDASERDGPIVASISNTILQPTAFSALS